MRLVRDLTEKTKLSIDNREELEALQPRGSPYKVDSGRRTKDQAIPYGYLEAGLS